MSNGLHFSSNGFIQFGDEEPIPCTDIKLELRTPSRKDHSDALAFWTGRSRALEARETEPGVWEVTK